MVAIYLYYGTNIKNFTKYIFWFLDEKYKKAAVLLYRSKSWNSSLKIKENFDQYNDNNEEKTTDKQTNNE